MRVDALYAAISEAERFLRSAKAVRTKINPFHKDLPAEVADYTRESAACKRASLDLTMALAELRKP